MSSDPTTSESPTGLPVSIKLPMLTLVLGALAVAFAPIFPKMAMNASEIGPIATAFWRMTLAAPILTIVWLATRSSRRGRVRPSMRPVWLLLPGVVFGFDLLTWHLSFPLTTAANATLLANLEVIMVGLVAWLILKEHLRWPFAVGGGLALMGVVLLMVASPAGPPGRSPLTGDLLAIFTAFWYAAYLLSIKWARRSFDVITVLLVVTLSGAVLLGLAALLAGESIWPTGSQVWVSLILLAIIPHCIGQGLIVFSLAKLPASLAAVTLLIQPVAAAVWGWIILAEALNNLQMLAGFIVLCGIGLARMGSRA